VADSRLELGVDYPALTCGWVSYIGPRTSCLVFFFGSEKCIYSVFVLPSADRAEPVVDDFLVLRYRLHAWALIWGICLLILNFSLSPTFPLLYKWTSVDMDICNDMMAISPRTYTYTFHSFLIFN